MKNAMKTLSGFVQNSPVSFSLVQDAYLARTKQKKAHKRDTRPMVTIRHGIKRTKAGEPIGLQLLPNDKRTTARIVAIYEGGMVQTVSGDVWQAEKTGKAYVTI